MSVSGPPSGYGGSAPEQPRGPLGVGATLGAAIRLYRADWTELWKVFALVVIPVQLLVFVLREITLPSGSVLRNSKIYVPTGTGGSFIAISPLADILAALVVLISIGAAYRILLGRYLHHPADLATSFGFALSRAGSLLWVSILTALVVLVGLILLIVPGVYLAFAFGIAVPVLMAEDRRGSGALERSRELIRGHWWHAVGCLLLAGIIAGGGAVLTAVIVGPIVAAVAPNSITAFLLINAVLDTIISIVLQPFTAAVSVVLYVDMLIRGDDPQLARLLA